MKRGEIYWCDLGEGIGSEQRGNRPVLIIQNDVGNEHSPTTIVAVITSSRTKAKLPTHKNIMLSKKSKILFEQIQTVDKTRIKDYIGWIDPKEWENQLKISLGL